jgi:hypothetical protein
VYGIRSGIYPKANKRNVTESKCPWMVEKMGRGKERAELYYSGVLGSKAGMDGLFMFAALVLAGRFLHGQLPRSWPSSSQGFDGSAL